MGPSINKDMGRQVTAEREELSSIRGDLARPQLEQKRTRRGVRAAQNHGNMRQRRQTGSCGRRGRRICGQSCGCGATFRGRRRTDKARGRGGGARTISTSAAPHARWRATAGGGSRATKGAGRGRGARTTSSFIAPHARWRATAGGGRRATKIGRHGGGARTVSSSSATHARS